ncbi:hypothetical protein [Flavobacterium sp. HSC-61S13]|uniref:hypothetical protein n=1 Tax=Flavobacterium sp. HSC-61S13 TaxID=2910963 RepID=UPI00209FD95A|nr:hypothetical protein [Flavobacterium sp. HSC-61S13]MCP1996684.1 hypothetical protein [Flavobacterium sp. HSC-61S13]
MKKALLVIAFGFSTFTAKSQNIIVNLDNKPDKEKSQDKQAGTVIKNKQERVLYVSKNGKYYYYQTSKTTGKEYKVYLKPEQIKK